MRRNRSTRQSIRLRTRADRWSLHWYQARHEKRAYFAAADVALPDRSSIDFFLLGRPVRPFHDAAMLPPITRRHIPNTDYACSTLPVARLRASRWDNPQKLWITQWTTPSSTPQSHTERGPQSNCRFFHQCRKPFFFIDLNFQYRLAISADQALCQCDRLRGMC